MSTNYQFESNEHFDEFIKQQVASGRYADANEVIRQGLRLLEAEDERRKEKLRLLKSLAEEGFRELDQGLGIEIKSRKELRRFIREIGRDVQARAANQQP